MAVGRLFEILYKLLNKRTITAGELAEHFEVSTRTIYRDIDTLSATGIPVYASKGKGGGISLLEGYSFNASMLTEREQEDVLAALHSLAAADYPDIHAVLHKMGMLFKKEGRQWLEVDFSPWGSEDQRRQLFPQLRQAIADSRLIQFRYYNGAGHESSRQAEPTQLLFKSKSWYLAAFCLASNAQRVFKISRMKDVVVLDSSFEPRLVAAAIDLAEEHAVRESVKITIRLSAKGAYRVFDEFDDAAITVNDDGSYTVSAVLPEGTWLYGYLLSFGDLLEAVEPERVRTSIMTQLDTMTIRLDTAALGRDLTCANNKEE
ncbi:putative DNA-binding transcriptional regulator YafY [Paenibacillus endophyticus]|uniref:Putative DNA-binding transcriptional regulator YafY n=1 Tax=Paenibacillus endophyticus TaxID=1294268 RepID=A0A7W5GBX7_9BACL|nr:YafY family protein [Paenibacillus endophyticus]MBB3153878.1 putative DNA-binding transcriptional regulator YafY [Paenibacillus endophyticus]